jgi:hypothetical protein
MEQVQIARGAKASLKHCACRRCGSYHGQAILRYQKSRPFERRVADIALGVDAVPLKAGAFCKSGIGCVYSIIALLW